MAKARKKAKRKTKRKAVRGRCGFKSRKLKSMTCKRVKGGALLCCPKKANGRRKKSSRKTVTRRRPAKKAKKKTRRVPWTQTRRGKAILKQRAKTTTKRGSRSVRRTYWWNDTPPGLSPAELARLRAEQEAYLATN